MSELEWIALVEAAVLAIAIGRALRRAPAPAVVPVPVEER